MKFNVLLALFIGVLSDAVLGDRTKENIYDTVIGNMCFRRLNATHQTGCTSAGKSTGSVGVLHLILGESDINFLLNEPPAPPYAAIVSPKDFTRDNILKLRDSPFVSAIVVVNDTKGMVSFSQELSCPNNFFRHDLQPTCNPSKPETTWNPYGTGLLQENFDIPIIFLADRNESEKVIKCYKDFNTNVETQKESSLCSIEINSFMAAAGNSEICMRRSGIMKVLNQLNYCDPLQGKNVYATLFPREIVDSSSDNRTVDKNEKIILITARLDTTSMFDGQSLGAMELASVATLFTTGHFLRKIIDNEVYERSKVNIMFVLFNGESYDFIGSQRFVYDLKKGDAFPTPLTSTNPLNFESIIAMIDIGMLDSFTDLTFYHIKENDMTKNFIASIEHYKNQLKLNINVTSKVTNNIPPVSAQTFLRENITFPAFVIATETPENKFYHSVFDDKSNLNYTYFNTSKDLDELPNAHDSVDENSVQIKIRNIASLIALGVYDILNGDHKYNQNRLASEVFVDEFLHCYLEATKCRLFEVIYNSTGGFKGSDVAPQRYVSVQANILLETTFWANRVFGFALSEKIPDVTRENCSVLPLSWIPGSKLTGECRRTTQNYSLALSPAFEDQNYNFKSNQYSTWTESTWNDLSARIFLRPSATHESLTFSIGFVVMILSFAFVYLISSKTDVLFGEVSAEHVSLPAQC